MSDEHLSKADLIDQSALINKALMEFLEDLSAKHLELKTLSVGVSLLTFGMDMYATAMREKPQAYMENVVEVAARTWVQHHPDIPIPFPPPEKS